MGFFFLSIFPPTTWMNAERLQKCPYIPELFQGGLAAVVGVGGVVVGRGEEGCLVLHGSVSRDSPLL